MTETAAPQISVNDLENVVKIIDAACERGAFKGKEMTTVGTVRDKVATFLESIPKAEEVEETAAEPEAPAAKPASRRKSKA